jgi:uroporphyrinogen-III synthase
MTLRLKNKLFISTRPKDSSDELANLLCLEGAKVIELPLIKIEAGNISGEEKNYFARLNQFHWIIFTSPNGIRHFFAILKTLTGSLLLPKDIKYAVIGTKTADALQNYGYKPSFINPGSAAEEFSISFLQHIKKSNSKPNILLPLGNLARTVIQNHLKDAAHCTRINIYKTGAPDQLDKNIVQRIIEDRYDMIIMTSPSGIHNFLKTFPNINKKNIRMACIGPITYREAIENGINPLIKAQKSSAEGIVESILNYYITKT